MNNLCILSNLTETQIQMAMNKIFLDCQNLNKFQNCKFILQFNNAFSLQDGAKKKRMGRKAGIPDVLLQCEKEFAWLEVKTAKAFEKKHNGLTKEQIAFFEFQRSVGVECFVECEPAKIVNIFEYLEKKIKSS